ncbi:ABC transporter permease [Dactylosporangium sp. NBC_01737]|uniref:ABC transporter permease n=1 Tax=Dactylosporangium sp. NBC_01737 TaxID=2975959 RepID=UPI002E0EAFBB
MPYAVRDSMTMLRRNLKHAQRYPSMTVSVVMVPVFILLLFNSVFGKALGVGIGGVRYIDYIAPGVILMAAASGALTTAVAVCVDKTDGIVNRFRTMAISRASFLTGHVVAGTLQTLLSIAVVVGLALLLGFRPSATPVEWLAAAGLLGLLAFALTWVSAGIGLVASNVESASNLPIPLQFLPFLGSAIVPADAMPGWLRWFAQYQPFTPVIETLRGLLTGAGIGSSGLVALAWCAVLGVVGYVWAKRVFARGVAG